MTEDRERALEEALGSGRNPSDLEVAPLLDQAEMLRSELHSPVPHAARERLLFVQGAAGRGRPPLPLGFLVPATAVVAGILAVAGFGRTALPGQTLYPVREAMASVGLADTAEEDIDRRLRSAREHLADARTLGLGDPSAAQALVLEAIGDLDRARALSGELPQDERAPRLATIGRLEERAVGMLVTIEEGPEPEDEIRGQDDNSGPGSESSGPGPGDGDGDDDNSGSGSDDSGGDDGDNNSGSGSDDSGGDDGDNNSGSGSDDSGGDDSSGSGSGGDDDNSGSGSDDSGGDDSSGSGSGGDDNGGDDNSGSGGGDDN